MTQEELLSDLALIRVRKAKAQLELTLARDVKRKKEVLCAYTYSTKGRLRKLWTCC